MLELKDIKKDYHTGNVTVNALKGINLRFRKNEFVAILGPSGCGKTSMLNILGGLDRSTEGDLLIGGISAGKYKDKDWDVYRNHNVGFVFQNYYLIPHQTVFQNVEITLTLSGILKPERKERVMEVLEKVGLSDQAKKHPGELSGGQMQRVAIARALVNNPDIILADEPTGALDRRTSDQIMEILKEISKDHLVIMVTHNSDIADRYASRIIRMKDGLIVSDSHPLTEEEILTDKDHDNERSADDKKKKLKGMNPATSLMLSVRNLFTKKGRTLLTAFAGSIGITGIALILAISSGTVRYLDKIQSDTSLISELIGYGYETEEMSEDDPLPGNDDTNKDMIEEMIDDYNASSEDEEKISYTDITDMIIDSITIVINAISKILIAFVAVSLAVSSIMIGVITYISVQERTKEIGILRAVGASKKDVAGLFTAETVITGFISGLIGVGMTLLLCLPINNVIHIVTDIHDLSAYLPVKTGAILVLISVLLTVTAGIIPSRSAAKKDPVEALKVE